jgi:hypothetical protein
MLTQKQKKLLAYIKKTNKETFLAANRANEDIKYWDSVGVTTPEELEKFWSETYDRIHGGE